MPQDQDDIKGADAMKQAPTPGPLSGGQHQWICKCCYTEFRAPQSEHLTDPFGGHAGAACPTCKAGGQFTYLVGFHQGDPCIHCRTPHDEVEPGPCPALRLAPSAPVEASGSEREAFENWYCDDGATVGIKMLPIEILALREGETYGPKRVALNSKWEAWQARAALDHG